ncbi:MAG: MqnA/MqnD/SBP family protein [bacterium]
MAFHLAAASFPSDRPLIDWLLRGREVEVDLFTTAPSRLLELLFADEVDAALLPVIDFFRGVGTDLVPGVGIASYGGVGIVKLFTRVPPVAIERVAVDAAAQTSVALLRIVLADLCGVRPDLHVVKHLPDDVFKASDSILLCGERCFEMEASLRRESTTGVHMLDLGKLWERMTKLPLVHSVWTLGSRFSHEATDAQRRELISILVRSRDIGVSNLDTIIAREAASGRPGPGGEATPAAWRRYYRQALGFVLGEEEILGLSRFYELCLQHAVCPAGRCAGFAAAS